MELLMVGLNYRSAPLEVREVFAFGEEEAKRRREALIRALGVREAAIIATCNRAEVYVAADAVGAADVSVSRFFRQTAVEADTPPWQPDWLYRKRGRDVAKHLFRVAAGLDSMVVGEAQILGQVRNVHQSLVEAGSGGPVLPRLFRAAVEAGKRSRTETEIGRGALSVSHAAVELAREIFGDLHGRRICLVGAGTMGELAARNLSAHGASTVIVNRTPDSARKLATELKSEAADLQSLARQLEEADVVVASTGSERPVITMDIVQKALPARRGQPLFLIDIAVPRDVEQGVEGLDGVISYNIDDLQEIVRRNSEERAREIPAVESIVDQEEERFFRWLQERRVAPLVQQMRERAERLRRDEVARSLQKHPELGEAGKAALDAATAALVNKLLHGPTMKLKEWSQGGMEQEERLQRAYELLGLVPELEGDDVVSTQKRAFNDVGSGDQVGALEVAETGPVSLSVRGETFGRRSGSDSGRNAAKRIGAASDRAGGGQPQARVSGNRF